MPEQKAPAVTFDNYVIPNTVQEYAPLSPAAPVHFATAPVQASEPAAARPAFKMPFGKMQTRVDPEMIAKSLLVVMFFALGALVGYYLSSGSTAELANVPATQTELST